MLQTTKSNSIQPFPRNRVGEQLEKTTSLHQTTLFPYSNPHRRTSITFATISFRFRSIQFDKKRALPFFLALELLTQQKGIAVLSKRNVLSRKIRKGMLVGCRVTLRRTSLFSFFDLLSLAVPRREKLNPPSRSARRRSSFFSMLERRRIENDLLTQGRTPAQKRIQKSAFSRKRDRAELFSFNELPLFPPFEIGLGLHPDVQRVYVSISFSSRIMEERTILLRSAKLPLV